LAKHKIEKGLTSLFSSLRGWSFIGRNAGGGSWERMCGGGRGDRETSESDSKKNFWQGGAAQTIKTDVARHPKEINCAPGGDHSGV